MIIEINYKTRYFNITGFEKTITIYLLFNQSPASRLGLLFQWIYKAGFS